MLLAIYVRTKITSKLQEKLNFILSLRVFFGSSLQVSWEWWLISKISAVALSPWQMGKGVSVRLGIFFSEFDRWRCKVHVNLNMKYNISDSDETLNTKRLWNNSETLYQPIHKLALAGTMVKMQKSGERPEPRERTLALVWEGVCTCKNMPLFVIMQFIAKRIVGWRVISELLWINLTCLLFSPWSNLFVWFITHSSHHHEQFYYFFQWSPFILRGHEQVAWLQLLFLIKGIGSGVIGICPVYHPWVSQAALANMRSNICISSACILTTVPHGTQSIRNHEWRWCLQHDGASAHHVTRADSRRWETLAQSIGLRAGFAGCIKMAFQRGRSRLFQTDPGQNAHSSCKWMECQSKRKRNGSERVTRMREFHHQWLCRAASIYKPIGAEREKKGHMKIDHPRQHQLDVWFKQNGCCCEGSALCPGVAE